MKVYITRNIHSTAHDMLAKHFTVHQNKTNAPIDTNKLMEVCNEYDAVLSTCADKINARILKNSKNLKLLSNYAVGLDNIDLQAAKTCNIQVFNTPDVVTNSTADHTVALILAITRKIHQGINFVTNNQWKSWDPHILLGDEISNKTIGIIGYGKIGRAVAKRMTGFTSNILFYDISISVGNDHYASYCDFEELLEKSDIISLHVPGLQANKHLIGEKAFEIIAEAKRFPYIINTARGNIVCTNSLRKALQKKIIRGVALDVIEDEPINSSHQLLKYENCIITPHIGTATIDTRINMAKLAAQNIIQNL